LAADLEVGGCAELGRLDEVVVDVRVDARLTELVERGGRRTARNEPRLEVHRRRVVELTELPDIVAVTADEVRAGVAVRLRVDDENCLADVSGHRLVAGE